MSALEAIAASPTEEASLLVTSLDGELSVSKEVIKVEDQYTYKKATERIIGLKDLKAKFEAAYNTICKPLHAAWKLQTEARAQRTKEIDKLVSTQQAERDRYEQTMKAVEEAADPWEVAEAVPAVAGLSSRNKPWSYREPEDLLAVAKAIAEGRMPANFICMNHAVVAPLVRQLGKSFSSIYPEIEVYQDKSQVRTKEK